MTEFEQPDPDLGVATTAPESVEPPTPEASVVTTLAAGRLHPGFLFLRLLDSMRQAIIPLGLALITQQPWLAVLVLSFMALGTVQGVFRYLTFEWVLTTEELITTEGLLHRQERRIPVNRIQDLNFESSLLRRVFGLVIVSVETASSQGAEARLDSLSVFDAEQLRATLLEVRSAKLGGDAVVQQDDEEVIYQTAPFDLVVRGLTTNRFGALLVMGFGVWQLSLEFGLEDQVEGLFGGVARSLASAATPILLVLVIAVGILALGFGWAVSIASAFLTFHGFTLSERNDVLQRRYGLITTRQATLPRRKIQRVLLEQSALRRLFGLVVVRADTAGSSVDENAESRSGSDIVTPLATQHVGAMLVPWLLDGVDLASLVWNPVSPKVVRRITMRSLVWACVLSGIGYATVGLVALASFLIVPLGFGAGLLAWRTMAWARTDGYVAFRWGILGRRHSIVPLRKVQAIVLRAGLIERSLGLASVTIYVAGGSPTSLGSLPREQAAALVFDVAHEAAANRFVW